MVKFFLQHEYIRLYKKRQNIIFVPWLAEEGNTESDTRFQRIETIFTTEEITRLRKWAFVEIKLEARRYFKNLSSNSGCEFVPLMSMWNNQVNDRRVFEPQTQEETTHAGRSEQVFLSNDEKKTLYMLLREDKGNVLDQFLMGKNHYNYANKSAITVTLLGVSVMFY